jgi:hypothetical protein
MTIAERIYIIAENEGITITGLERNIGASKGVLSRAIKNKTDIQSKWLAIIVENYPQYNAAWLLTGKGDMLLGESTSEPSIKTEHTVIDKDCKLCKEKDARLHEQTDTIKDLKYDKAELREQLLETKLRLE